MRTSKVRVIALATLVLVACAALLAPGTADARRRKKRSTVTIVVNGGDFSGRVITKKACRSEREVIVFRQTGDTRSPTTDTEIASDTSDEDGKWNTGNTGANNGRYYAHAPATTDCKALTSKSAEVTGRPGGDDDEDV